jgi:uncharacterized membrane protein HdeD (DUF308 family)
MRNKQKVDIMASMLCIFLGGLLLLFPLMKYTDINTSFMTIMFVYSIINSGKYLITKDLSDFKTILSSLASLFIGSLAFMIKVGDSSLNLAILFFVWIIFQSLIKLKKADYYNDRNNRLWILEISFLVIFILMGILTAINLNYNSDIQILMLGFFFFTNGVLEFIEPIILILTKECNK